MSRKIATACMFALVLALATAPGCKRGDAIVVELRIALVVDEHPWVMAFLTALAVDPPVGVEARLDGRFALDGRRQFPEAYFVAEDRKALGGALAHYEAEHPRPPELLTIWEPYSIDLRPAWRLHFIDQTRGLVLDEHASATLERDELLGPVVLIHLGPDQRERFAALTETYVGHRIAVALGDEALSVPILATAIPGGRVQITAAPSVDPEVASPALFERLTKP
jgi:hypothetical protein